MEDGSRSGVSLLDRDRVSRDTVERINHTGIHQGIRFEVCSRCGGDLDTPSWCPKCKATVKPKKEPCQYCSR